MTNENDQKLTEYKKSDLPQDQIERLEKLNQEVIALGSKFKEGIDELTGLINEDIRNNDQ